MPAQPFSRFFHHTALAKLGNPTELDSEYPKRSELRSRREERNLNGVKNLLGARPFLNTLIKQSRTDLEMFPTISSAKDRAAIHI